MKPQNALLRLEQVGYQVKSAEHWLTILKDITLTIKSGTSLAISGVSGSGKTSLLNLMAGLELPSTGHIYYENQDITLLDEDARAKLRARKVGFVFQSFQLLNNLTAVENVCLPLEINQIEPANEIALSWLNKLGLSARAHHYPNQLSGGEQQRVAIARAFASKPSILFADEPTGNLDLKTGENISNLLFELNQSEHTTLIIVTHDLSLAKRCELHYSLQNGQLLC